MQALLNAVQRLLELFAAYLAGKYNGRKDAEHGQAQKALRQVSKANEAASSGAGMSRADRVRYLRERGLLRGIPSDDSK
jgi:hypothetical protein